jgi:hypothetical protein
MVEKEKMNLLMRLFDLQILGSEISTIKIFAIITTGNIKAQSCIAFVK